MKRNYRYIVICCFVIISFFFLPSVWAQTPRQIPEKKPGFLWYRFDEGLKKAEEENKNIMINFYTQWCGFCKKMDKYTFGDEEIKKILVEGFVPIKVDAGSKTKLTLGKEKITEKDLALKYGITSYPMTLFLKPTGEKIPWTYNPVKGYIGAEIFSEVLNYLKDDLYKKISFKDYLTKKEQDKKEKK
jgi:thioredoxin-related protein